MHRYLISLGAALAVSGCATMNEQECVTADWETVGYEDGADGRDADRIGQHRRACADHGVAPDLVAYEQGRERGLERYCTASRGFSEGKSGTSYKGVCPVHLEDAFLTAYNDGKRLHDLEEGIDDAESRMSTVRSRLKDIDGKIAQYEADLIAGVIEKSTRARLVSRTRELSSERGELEQELRDLERQIGYDESELDQLRREVSY